MINLCLVWRNFHTLLEIYYYGNAPESDGGTEIPAIPEFNIYSNGNVDLIGTQFEGKNFNTIRIQWAQQQANIADTFTSAVDNQGRTMVLIHLW